jgi:hypothetical protein
MADQHHVSNSKKREDKIPVAAASSSVKVPKKKGRKVKPKVCYVNDGSTERARTYYNRNHTHTHK